MAKNRPRDSGAAARTLYGFHERSTPRMTGDGAKTTQKTPQEIPHSAPTSVLIVDDHALVCEGLRGILEAQDDLCVVGQASDSATAIALAADQHPDVVLLDIEIPGGDAATTVRKILDCSPQARVIILSMYEGPQLVDALLTAGVRGYLLKSIQWQELVAAIRAIVADNDRVVLGVSRESLRPIQHEPTGETLSAREREVLALVGEALSNRQIAARLSLTEATIKRHLRNIFVKLGAVSRMDAVNKATQLPNQPRTPRRARSGREMPPPGQGLENDDALGRSLRPRAGIRPPRRHAESALELTRWRSPKPGTGSAGTVRA